MASIFRKTEKKSPFVSITADLQLDRAEQQEPLFMLEKSKRQALQSRIVQLIRGETIPEVWSKSSAPVMRRRLKQTCLPPYISSADLAFLIMSSIVRSDQRRQPSTRPVLQLLAWFADTDKQLFTASHHATRDRNARLAKTVSDFADQLKSAVTRRVWTLLHDASARTSSVRFFRQAPCASEHLTPDTRSLLGRGPRADPGAPAGFLHGCSKAVRASLEA
ncbi:MAG: hypothetical protein KVP17_001162 [Porospora cf. gigantea B]|uniref:uncharacterized protein n=1 Tax=Porospora cf. gigantea B TaxID=2853592 RepID=UPI003571F32B|nr:MAG: hypothetical protein KVP17_001162 [Porospora cf. gigantea B]